MAPGDLNRKPGRFFLKIFFLEIPGFSLKYGKVKIFYQNRVFKNRTIVVKLRRLGALD
jgi:hypothetical protein